MKKLRKSLALIFLTLVVIPLSVFAWTGPQSEAFSTTVEWQTPPTPPGFSPAEPYSPLWHFNNSTFYVWADINYRPWVTQVTNGKATTVPLDEGADYTAQPDGHNRFSMGIDSEGYIHIAGDMHSYINETITDINPYPVRYQKQTILYWKSAQPANVSGGFTFAGGLNASTAIPGGGWMQGRFFADNNDVLYYSSEVHAYESLTNLGQHAVGLYVYNTSTQTWKAIGGLADVSQPYMYNQFPVFYWELAGLSGWFQNYEPSFKFDTNNYLHFTVSAITNNETTGAANRVLYAYSKDGGDTWLRANGSVIPSLPIRGVSTEASVGDVIADSGTSTNYFGAPTGMLVDKYGQRGSSFNIQPSAFNTWYTWSGSAWNTDNKQNLTNLPISGWGYRLNDNNLVFKVAGVSKLLFTDSFHDLSYGFDLPEYSDFINIDDHSVTTDGVIWGIGSNSTTNINSIVRVQYSGAPLPKGWSCNDIATTTPGYGGTCGYQNNTFVATNYGTNINDYSDNFFFIYQTLTGDGTLITQTNNILSSTTGSSEAGIMMRNTLDPDSINVNLLLYPESNTAYMGVRNAAGAGAINYNATGISNPYWLKLVRSGNNFTSYVSPNGTKWTEIQTIAVPMNQTIYVGMASASYTHNWFMQQSSFSNVSVTTP